MVRGAYGFGGNNHEDKCPSDHIGVPAANMTSLMMWSPGQVLEGFTTGGDVVVVCHILEKGHWGQMNRVI